MNTFYVHVHETCSKCNGCIYECEHRVKIESTTTTYAPDDIQSPQDLRGILAKSIFKKPYEKLGVIPQMAIDKAIIGIHSHMQTAFEEPRPTNEREAEQLKCDGCWRSPKWLYQGEYYCNQHYQDKRKRAAKWLGGDK